MNSFSSFGYTYFVTSSHYKLCHDLQCVAESWATALQVVLLATISGTVLELEVQLQNQSDHDREQAGSDTCPETWDISWLVNLAEDERTRNTT